MPLVLLGQGGVDQTDSIVHALIGLHFSDARRSIDKLSKTEGRMEFNALYQMLHNKGREREKDSFLISKLEESTVGGERKITTFLAKAYYNLYNNRNDTISFSYFDKAYILSKNRGTFALRKLSILGFLHLYSKEIVLNSNAFSTYLEEYKTMPSSVDDLAWQVYFDNYFTLSILDDDRAYLKTSRALISFLEQNELSEVLAAYFYKDIGLFYKLGDNKDSAQVYFEKVLDLPDVNSIIDKKCNVLLYLADINGQDGNFEKSDQYLKLSHRYKAEVDPLAALFNSERFRALYYYQHMKKYDSAFFLLKKSIHTEAQLGIKTNRTNISRLNVQLRTAEKENEILLQRTQIEKEQRQKRILVLGSMIFLTIGSVVAVLLQKNTTKKRQLAEQEVQLKQQRVENLLKNQELVSIDAMIAGQEKERKRVAGELHDDLGSLMAAIKLHFDNAKIGRGDPALKNAQRLLDEAYQKVRGMAHSKNSGVMSDQGLLQAIKKMAKTLTDTDALEVTVEDFGLGERMENTLELSIFRMVQELVANAIKHAEATKVNIQLTQHEENLNIIVEDNGKGFERAKLGKDSMGMGLTTIEKRVEHLEGSFTVDSVLGKGTSILIDIPV